MNRVLELADAPPVTVYRVTLPLPPKVLSPNYAPPTVRAKCRQAKARADYRLQCREALRKANVPPLGRVTLHLDFYLFRGKPGSTHHYRHSQEYFPLDADNARGSCKSLQDSVVDAGIVPDDRSEFVRTGRVTLHKTAEAHQGRTCLILTLETILERG